MKYLIKNKKWNIVEEYNLDKLLYLLVDRPTSITGLYIRWIDVKNNWGRKYKLPACANIINGYLAWYVNDKHIKTYY